MHSPNGLAPFQACLTLRGDANQGVTPDRRESDGDLLHCWAMCSAVGWRLGPTLDKVCVCGAGTDVRSETTVYDPTIETCVWAELGAVVVVMMRAERQGVWRSDTVSIDVGRGSCAWCGI